MHNNKETRLRYYIVSFTIYYKILDVRLNNVKKYCKILPTFQCQKAVFYIKTERG